jgi:8-oxo-dGTP diphosphatase
VTWKRIIVVAAVIERDGQILIGQRRAKDRHPLKWEFPGGKLEPHETPRAALRRELKEELDIDARIGPEIARYEFQYPKRTPILLIFFRVTEFAGEVRNGVFEQLRWEARERLPEYDFLDGDVDFVRRLAGGKPLPNANPRGRARGQPPESA